MFGKSDPMNGLSRDLSRARDKRDALASHVTTLTAQIAELEARLSAENDRRERERVVSEIEGIKERLRDFYLAFAQAIAGMRDASVSARAIVPEAPELSNLLIEVATEVANTVDNLLGGLDRRLEILRASQATSQIGLAAVGMALEVDVLMLERAPQSLDDTLSIQRPRPSIEVRTPAASVPVNARLVN
jgi:hypothetical protein